MICSFGAQNTIDEADCNYCMSHEPVVSEQAPKSPERPSNLSESYESDILKMVWKKTRVACSVRLSDGITYSFRSLKIKKKKLLMKCSRSGCKASVLLEIGDFMLPDYVRDKSKRSSAASILDLDKLTTCL